MCFRVEKRSLFFPFFPSFFSEASLVNSFMALHRCDVAAVKLIILTCTANEVTHNYLTYKTLYVLFWSDQYYPITHFFFVILTGTYHYLDFFFLFEVPLMINMNHLTKSAL
ncbi:hypothetical protein EGW08_000040 [Elysia chlorotica]|uniref:Uncharacterized protein n=1 Tax=Elysia chlorotica TaxID=188477 RepID=A0A433UE99_ELYCH|nr:hypothetical protein EGW08_000040 [Elysia chlorotica]